MSSVRKPSLEVTVAVLSLSEYDPILNFRNFVDHPYVSLGSVETINENVELCNCRIGPSKGQEKETSFFAWQVLRCLTSSGRNKRKPTAVKGTRLTPKLWEFDEPVESVTLWKQLKQKITLLFFLRNLFEGYLGIVPSHGRCRVCNVTGWEQFRFSIDMRSSVFK